MARSRTISAAEHLPDPTGQVLDVANPGHSIVLLESKTSSTYIELSTDSAAPGNVSVCALAWAWITYCAQNGEAVLSNDRCRNSYTSGSLEGSKSRHKNLWKGRSLSCRPTCRNISEMSALKATGARRKRVRTSTISRCSFGPGRMLSFNSLTCKLLQCFYLPTSKQYVEYVIEFKSFHQNGNISETVA
jgi:hypothetical protein